LIPVSVLKQPQTLVPEGSPRRPDLFLALSKNISSDAEGQTLPDVHNIMEVDESTLVFSANSWESVAELAGQRTYLVVKKQYNTAVHTYVAL